MTPLFLFSKDSLPDKVKKNQLLFLLFFYSCSQPCKHATIRTKKNSRRIMYSALLIILYSFCFYFPCSSQRSILRPRNTTQPTIATHWVDDTTKYELKSDFLEAQALFNKFDKEYFMARLLPQEEIAYRNQEKKATGGKLRELIEELLQEIYQHKKKFKNFTILKSKDFNYRTTSGLLILKFNDHPFVIKLFMETPESFVQPFSKGWQPGCFFVMGGGINRYLSGFTRIKNLEEIRKHIATDSTWSKKLDTPRKWFWIPDQCRWFQLQSHALGTQDYSATLPAVYAIIADEIKSDKKFNIFNREHRKFALSLCHFLGNRIDPHIDNFMKEEGTGLTLIADTEHFPTMIGLRKELHFSSYGSWYAQLTAKCVQDCFFRNKRVRRNLQINPEKILPC